MTFSRIPRLLAAAALTLAVSLPASAAVLTYTTELQTLNSRAQVQTGNPGGVMPDGFVGSTARGTSTLTLDTAAGTLRVRVNATGLEGGIPHLAHIHGNLNNNTQPGSGPRDSQVPTLAQDTDGDGFIEVAEGAATYGPILLDLGVIGDTSTINFDTTFDLFGQYADVVDAMFGTIDRLDPDAASFGPLDLIGENFMALAMRHIVIHGLTVPFEMGNAGSAPNEVDGTTTFLPGEGDGGDPFEGTVALPVANGEFTAVPEPGMVGLLGLGVLGVGFARRRHILHA